MNMVFDMAPRSSFIDRHGTSISANCMFDLEFVAVQKKNQKMQQLTSSLFNYLRYSYLITFLVTITSKNKMKPVFV